jgi:serine phosphatase RsbU (regulator of sigma subunit)
VLLLGCACLPRLTTLRSLGPERRLQLLAGLALGSMILLRLAGPAYNEGILAGTRQGFHIDLINVAILLAGCATSLALGLAGSAVLDDTRPGAPRVLAGVLFLLPFLISLCSAGWAPIIAIPIAIRTGWARQLAEGRGRLATVASIVGVVAVLTWPVISPATGACWAPREGLPGSSIFHFGRTFLFGQLGVLALRFLLGLVFGPRRIGRRLLVSHMLAGLVPVALTALFAILISLLALANLRASVASDLLRMQHGYATAALEKLLDEDMEEMSATDAAGVPRWSRDRLGQMAERIARRWPEVCSWCIKDSAAAGAVVGPWVAACARVGEEDLTVLRGDTANLAVLPPRAAWCGRPNAAEGCGLLQYAGRSYHVADRRTPESPDRLRVQVIEHLPFGRVRVLEDHLGKQARIDESYTLTYDFRLVSDGLAESDVATTSARPSNASPLNSGHELIIGQTWHPGDEDPSPAGTWRRIRIPVLGISGFGELMPQLPDNLVEAVPLLIFTFTALLFVGVEIFAFISALRMGRAIAQSVNILREGTERLRRGDLTYRIEMTGEDELASLGEAFNEMAMGLEEGQRTALEKERLESEMALARRIQRRLLPGRPPEMAGLQLAGISVPARHVGGDYYDFLPMDEGKLLVVMADVSGKGAPAAILMSSLRASLHSMLASGESLAELARRLNRFVYASTDSTEFITFFFGVIDGRTGRFTYVNAGHEHPYLLRKDSSVERLEEGGLVLGAFPEAPYEEATVKLHSDDILFLFTDGLTEAHNPIGDMFGEEPLARLLPEVAHQEPEGILKASLAEVDSFVRGAEPSDDITLLAIRKVNPI